MKVVVIGSNSFSGSDYINRLLDENDSEVIGMSRSEEKSRLFLPYKDHPRYRSAYQFFQCDINKDINRMIDIMRAFRPDYIVNFASQSEVAESWDRPGDWYQTNCVGMVNLIEGIRKHVPYIRSFLQISTPEVYGSCTGAITEGYPSNPSTPYAASRAATDVMLGVMHRTYGLPILAVRATNVYGSHQQLWKIVPRAIIRIKKGEKIILQGGGLQVRSYIHISDVSNAELLVMRHGLPESLYHISPDSSISIRDLVATICNIMGADFNTITEEAGERLGNDAAHVINSDKLRSTLNWAPTISIEDGIRETIEWVDGNWNDIVNGQMEYIHKE